MVWLCVVVLKFSSSDWRIFLICISQSCPDSGCPWRKIGSTFDWLIGLANVCSYHSAYALSIELYLFILSPGEWANASLAAHLYTLRFRFTAIAKKRHSGLSVLHRMSWWGPVHGVAAQHIWICYNIGLLFKYCIGQMTQSAWQYWRQTDDGG